MLLIYIIMSTSHNQNSAPGINNNNGHVKSTPKLPKRPNIPPWNNSSFPAPGNQGSALTFQTAPRNTERVGTTALNQAGYSKDNLSYHYSPNTNSGTNLNLSNHLFSDVDPVVSNTGNPYNQRPQANPYFLFFGKFASTTVQNMKPDIVGHYDVSGGTINQQPSNIYNIPDIPKNYTMFESGMTGYSAGDPLDGVSWDPSLADDFTTNKIIYDASSCPVNWRMFGPIREQVLDWSANGVIGGGGSLNAGLYDISNNGSFFFVSNPTKRDISGIYFDTNDFDLSFNPATNPNAYISIKGGAGGGSGTDLSFNNYFFKQPEMPLDCSAVFVNANPKRLELSWDIPFNRLSGTSYLNNVPRFFCKNDESENWLPAFNDFILDISGVVTGSTQTFCKDALGNFVPNNGTTKAYAIISPNNTKLILNDVASTATGANRNQSSSVTKYGTTGQTTTINGGIVSGDSSRNIDGRGLTINSNTPIFQAGNIYDIAMYYHNNSKINTPPGLAVTDVKYNNHNVCLLKDVIFGVPGNAQQPASLLLWGNPSNNGSRYYFGGIGGNAKDVELNLPWDRTSLVRVGYDCSLNVTYNVGSNGPIQVVGINRQNLSYSNYDVSYNLNLSNPQPYPPLNMNAGSSGSNVPGTKKNWPSGTGAGGINAVSSSATADSDFDYIKKIDELTGIPVSLARDHPEYKYTAENYSVVNDTIDPSTNTVTYIHKTPAYTFTGVIPIFPRSVCNTKNDTDYNDMMTEYTETPTNNSNPNFLTIYKEDNGGNLINAGTGISARTRFQVNSSNETYTNIIAFGDKNNPNYYKLRLKSDNRVFRQLANYGEAKTGIRPSQNINDLVPLDSMIGALGTSLLGQVKLFVESGGGSTNASFTSIRDGRSNSKDIYGWDTTLSYDPNNIPQTLTVNAGGQNYTFSLSDAFDIAEDENTLLIPTNFSNKKGYYLGFDISNVELEADITDYTLSRNLYKDSALYTDYGEFRVRLNNVIKKRAGTDTSLFSSITFRMMDASWIGDINCVSVKTNGHYNSVAFEWWFGIKRLPTENSSNSGTDRGQLGGQQCELQLDVSLNNIHTWWIPPKSQVTSGNNMRDNIFEAEFVLNPNAGSNAIRIQPKILVSGIDGQEYFPWIEPSSTFRDYLPKGRDLLDASGNAYTSPPAPVVSGSGAGATVSYPTSSYRVKAFREIHDGITQITTTGSNTIPFSRTVTDTGNTLFGIQDHKFAYSNNVTRDNIGNYPSGASAMRTITLTAAERDNFKFGPVGTKKELFWDYTWPKDTVLSSNLPNLPTGFTLSTTNNNPSLRFMHTEAWNTSTAGYSSVAATSGIWGGSNIELLNLESLLTNNNSVGIEFKHNATLSNNQSMWCNGFFTGIITNRSQIQNPYINYQAEFFNLSTSSSYNYSGKKTTGANIHTIRINNTVLLGTNATGNYIFPQTSHPFSTTGTASNSTEKKKLILFEVLNTTSDFKVTITGRTSSGTSDIVLTNGVHFFLFYCEKKGSTGTSYSVTNINASGTTTTTTGDYSGWLNSLGKKQFSGTSGINSIGYANANTNGSNNGCALSTSNFTNNITIVQAQTGVRKFILIALFEDCLIKNVTIT